MTTGDEQLVETLRLARDLCIGIGAFYVSPAGRVAFALSPVVTLPDVGNRIEMLAQACLTHPEARGRELFWNAEVTVEGESADDSLACVALPLRADREWLGLLGVVDTWLPELDDEQRTGLLRLAQGLARRLVADPVEAELSRAHSPRSEPLTYRVGGGRRDDPLTSSTAPDDAPGSVSSTGDGEASPWGHGQRAEPRAPS